MSLARRAFRRIRRILSPVRRGAARVRGVIARSALGPEPLPVVVPLRRLGRAVRRRTVILMYHRVASLDADVHGLAVSPAHFDAHMAVVAANYSPIRLEDLVGGDSLPDRAVAVTLDDGYVDLHSDALPILRRHGVPATAFIVSGSVGLQREYWWDRLERLLLSGPLPPHLELVVSGRRHRLDTGDPDARSAAHRLIHLAMLPLSATEQDRVLADISTWSGQREAHRASHRTLTLEELSAVDAESLLDIGAHTVTHAHLGALDVDDQRREMVDSRAWLEDVLGHPIRAISYPYGGYGGRTPDIARHEGFVAAVTVEPRPVFARSDPMRLGRFNVGDWDAGEFSRRLDRFSLGII